MNTKQLARFLLPLTLLIMLSMLLLPSRTTIFAQGAEDRWAGVVSDENGAPLAATVTINDQSVQADEEGSFELYVERTEDNRYVINAEMFGYASVSNIHIGSSIESMALTLKKAQEFEIEPSQAIEIEDERGTYISIPPDSLIDADGNPATAPLQLYLYTYDLQAGEMPGDMTGRRGEEEIVALESSGAFFAEFRDAEGNLYNLAPGVQAEISVPVSPALPSPPDVIALWSYEQESGLWLEEGEAARVDERYVGQVSHFSEWNFDLVLEEEACIKLTVEPSLIPIDVRMEVYYPPSTSPSYVTTHTLTDPINVLHNLPANPPTNAVVHFYVPSTSTTPYAIVSPGAPWGGTWTPPYPYDECNGELHIDGEPQSGTITGMKFHDLNGNGVKDADEPGLEGWEITLTDADGNIITTTTDANGNYQFIGLAPGTYTVAEVQQDGWTQTFPAAPGTHTLDLSAGQELEAIDFGNTTCTPPPPDMVAWWPLDEMSGPIAADIMGGNDGTHTNGPTPIAGMVDYALDFDGVDDYVEVPDAADLNFGTGDFSIDAWVKTTDSSGVKLLVDKRYEQTSGDVQGYSLFLGSGQLGFQLADGDGSWFCSTDPVTSSCTNYGSGTFVADGEWHLVAVTVDRDQTDGGKFYVDGALVATFDPTIRSGSLTNTKPLRIGSRSSFETGLFNGAIDEVELFNRALDVSEIQAIYNAGSSGKCKCVTPPDNMVAWWHLDETSGTSAADIAMYPNDGTHFNNPTPVTGMVDGALSFNGSNQYVEVPDHGEINFAAAITGTDAGDFSIDAWILTSQTTGIQIIVDKRQESSGPVQGYTFFILNNQLGFQLADGTGFTSYVSGSSVNVTDGQWHHVAVTVNRDDTAGIIWYVDGIASGIQRNPTVRMGSLINNKPLRIGRRSDAGGGFFKGIIDEVEIFDRVLDPNEINAIYQAGSAGKCKCIEEEVTSLAGVEDEFSTANGTEPTYRSPGLDSYITYASDGGFDETSVNRFFGQTFEFTDTRRICDAWLEIRVKPLGTIDHNDTIHLDFIDSLGQRAYPGAGWGRYLGSGNASAGLLSTQWGATLTPVTFNLHLSQLPMADGSLKDIVPILDQLRYLDVMVQDDTSVDYVKLTVAYCCDDVDCCSPEKQSDFGDAPDSTNHFTPTMTTYPSAVIANFPTVFDADPAPGPKHIAPKAEAWLGEGVSIEKDADLFADYDTVNNIYPPANVADRDLFDDGVDVNNLALPECGMADFSYTVNSVGSLSEWYVNAWFDFNQDGDWDDIYECQAPNGTYLVIHEWAVQDQAITVSAGTGLQPFTTPSFAAMGSPESEMWMRVTLSEAQAATPADGRGPTNGFEYGETEDYLLPPREIEACDLTIEKTHNDDFVVGQNGSYSLVVTNLGSTNCDPTIQVNDLLPTGLSYISASGSGWSCSNSGTNVSCTYGSPLAPAASSNINLTVHVEESAVPGVTNCAEVQGADDTNLSNNESCDEVIVTLSTGTVIIELEPYTLTTGVAQPFELPILVHAGTQEVDGASAHLNFDPAHLEVVSIAAGSDFSTIILNQFDNDSGQLDFTAGSFDNFPSGTFTLATVTFNTTALTDEDGTAVEFNMTPPRSSDVTFDGSSVLDHTEESTIFIENATLTGAVTLQGRPTPPHPRWSVPLRVSFTVPGESTPAYEFTPTTDENGRFPLSGIAPGTYEVRVKNSHTLQNKQTVTIVGGDNGLIDFGTLLEGDANDDNYVTLVDFSILVSTFAKCEGSAGYDARADFNGDGCVTILDFSLLASNFAQSGDHRPEEAEADAPIGDAKLIIDQPIIGATSGETYLVTVRIEAETAVDGAAAYIDFDQSLLKVNSIRSSEAFDIELQEAFDNQTGTIEFAAGTLESPLDGNFDLLLIELEAIGDGESPLLFGFDMPRSTDVTAGGQSVLTEYIDGSNPTLPTAVAMQSLTAQRASQHSWLALFFVGLLMASLVGWRRGRS